MGDPVEKYSMQKPLAAEVAPYAWTYIDLIADEGSVVDQLRDNIDHTIDVVSGFDEQQLVTPCGPGEWTIKEIVQHVADGERILAYRALRFARGDTTDLAGYDHDAYVPASLANQRPLAELLDEFWAVRRATVALFGGLTDEMWLRQGTANGYPLSVRAAAYFIAGHERHHALSIQENYGRAG